VLGITDSTGLKTFLSDGLPTLDTAGSKKLRMIIDILRKEKQGAYSPARIIVNGHPNTQTIFYDMLIEDAIRPNDDSYRTFLCKVHGNILSLQSLS